MLHRNKNLRYFDYCNNRDFKKNYRNFQREVTAWEIFRQIYLTKKWHVYLKLPLKRVLRYATGTTTGSANQRPNTPCGLMSYFGELKITI